jgi:chaperonin GroES
MKRSKKEKIKRVVKKIMSKKSLNINTNKSGVIPLNDRVLVKPLEEEMTKTASGIIIPDTVSKEKPEQGEVVAVGDGKWIEGKKIPLSVKIGDRVVFSRYGFDEVKIGGVEYYILKEENILAVLKN